MILLTGLYFTFRLKCLQLTKLKMGFSYLFKKKDSRMEGEISHYQAIASVLAGNFGTGNISGMAIALSTGGIGALVWMWVMTFLGSIIQYANCLLGVKYRSKNPKGEFVGGPMYYLSEGLRIKSVASIFSIFLIIGAFTVGNFVQMNSLVLPLQSIGIEPGTISLFMTFFIGLVIFQGRSHVAKVSSSIVPIMGLIYLGTATFILGNYPEKTFFAICNMFKAAWNGDSVVGGTFGFAFMTALSTGFHRAIFATDLGTGIAPILQANAKTHHPVVDGIVALTAPFVVMIVCTVTGLVLIVTGAFQTGLQSTNMVAAAFKEGIGSSGPFIVMASLVLFGYTTALAWAKCMERGVEFLIGQKFVRPFQLLYVILVPVGAFLRVDFVWILADIVLSAMLVLNLIGIVGLSKEVIHESYGFFLVDQIEKQNI
ncbi:MAG: amino acid carrier protein [Chlamydiales bacterium]